jgi:hypothetical protein
VADLILAGVPMVQPDIVRWASPRMHAVFSNPPRPVKGLFLCPSRPTSDSTSTKRIGAMPGTSAGKLNANTIIAA